MLNNMEKQERKQGVFGRNGSKREFVSQQKMDELRVLLKSVHVFLGLKINDIRVLSVDKKGAKTEDRCRGGQKCLFLVFKLIPNPSFKCSLNTGKYPQRHVIAISIRISEETKKYIKRSSWAKKVFLRFFSHPLFFISRLIDHPV